MRPVRWAEMLLSPNESQEPLMTDLNAALAISPVCFNGD